MDWRRILVAIRALSGVDVAIKRGSVHGLIGPNGSGKSTFINVVTGVFRPSAGKITLFGGKELPPLGTAPYCRLRNHAHISE